MSYGCWIGCCSNFKWCTLRSITSSRGSIAVGNEYDSAIPFLDFSSGCILSIINHKRFILYLLLRKNYCKFWIIPPFIFIEVAVPSQETEWSCIYVFLRIEFASFYDFSIGFWKCGIFCFYSYGKNTYTKRRFGPVRKPRGNQYMLLLAKALKVQCYQILYMYM